jgi:hypothetical protein
MVAAREDVVDRAPRAVSIRRIFSMFRGDHAKPRGQSSEVQMSEVGFRNNDSDGHLEQETGAGSGQRSHGTGNSLRRVATILSAVMSSASASKEG